MYEIAESTHQHIGVTTLKRLFGFVGGTSKPRMSTLDVLANFLNFQNYNKLICSLDPDNKAGQMPILQLNAQDICCGTHVQLFFSDGHLCMEHQEGIRFRVLESTDAALQPNDYADIRSFHVGYPIYVHRLVRGNIPLNPCAVAMVSGIERIEIAEDGMTGND